VPSPGPISSFTPFLNGSAVIRGGGASTFDAKHQPHDADYRQVRDRQIEAGSMFTSQDNQDRSGRWCSGPKVAVYLFYGDVGGRPQTRTSVGPALTHAGVACGPVVRHHDGIVADAR